MYTLPVRYLNTTDGISQSVLLTVLEEWAYQPGDCGLFSLTNVLAHAFINLMNKTVLIDHIPSRFTVNFVRGNDIAFHLNPRFNDGGKQAVVRNTMVGERWGKEERHTQGGFPFMAGQSFEVSGNFH